MLRGRQWPGPSANYERDGGDVVRIEIGGFAVGVGQGYLSCT